jgi:CheY-like chemotaxis protein
MDIMMPGMDGLTALGEIKKIDRFAKVVMCTSLKEAEQEKKAQDLGAVGYITKPFSSEDIIREINKNI